MPCNTKTRAALSVLSEVLGESLGVGAGRAFQGVGYLDGCTFPFGSACLVSRPSGVFNRRLTAAAVAPTRSLLCISMFSLLLWKRAYRVRALSREPYASTWLKASSRDESMLR